MSNTTAIENRTEGAGEKIAREFREAEGESILERITENEIKQWMIARMKSERLDAMSIDANKTGHESTLWYVHRNRICKSGITLDSAIVQLLDAIESTGGEAAMKRAQAARLIQEAEELEKSVA